MKKSNKKKGAGEMFPKLETERLILREINEEDAEAIYGFFSRPEVTRYYGQEPFTAGGQASQLVDVFARNFREKRGIRWGIEIKGERGLIGTIGFNAWVPKHKRAEIGYELHPLFWRNGYAAEALNRVVSYGFEELLLNRIGAVVFIENNASNQLLMKMGFEKEGILKNYMHQNGESFDTYIYSLLKEKRLSGENLPNKSNMNS